MDSRLAVPFAAALLIPNEADTKASATPTALLTTAANPDTATSATPIYNISLIKCPYKYTGIYLFIGDKI
jgi:hypothetical protein